MKRSGLIIIVLVLAIIGDGVLMGLYMKDHAKIKSYSEQIQSLEAIQAEYTNVVNSLVGGQKLNENIGPSGYSINISRDKIVFKPKNHSICDYYGVAVNTSGAAENRMITKIELYKP